MKQSFYFKILLAPLAALSFSACSPNLYNQPQEYDDIYFTSADRKQAPVVQKKVESNPASVQDEKIAEVQKTYSVDEYSPQYVDPAIVEKYNNATPITGNVSLDGPFVDRPSVLNYDDFLADLAAGYTQETELPLNWGVGYWSRTDFNQRVVQDLQFRNAWYDYYYRGYEGSLNNYFGRFEFNQAFNSRVNFGVNPIFRPRFNVRIGFGWGRFYDPFWDPFRFNRWNRWNAFYDPFYDPFFSPGFFFGSSFWCPPTFSVWDPFFYDRYDRFFIRNSYAGFYNRRFFVDDGFNAGVGRDIQRGPRATRSSITSVRNDAVNGRSGSRANIATLPDARGSSNLGTRSSRNGGRAVVSNSVTNSGSTRSGSTTGKTRSSVLRGRSSSVTSTGSIATDSYEFGNRGSRSSSTIRSRSSRVSGNNYSGSRYGRSSYNNSSRSSRSSFSRTGTDDRGSTFGRAVGSSRSYEFGRSSGSSRSGSISRGRSSGSSRSGSVNRSRSSGSSRSGSISRGRSSGSSRSGSVSRGRSSGSSRSGSVSRSRSSGSSRSGSISRGSSSRSGSISRGSSRSGSSRSGSVSRSSSRSGSSRSGSIRRNN